MRIREQVRALLGLSPRVGIFMRDMLALSFLFEVIKLIPPFVFKEIIDRLVIYDPVQGLTFALLIPLLLGYAGSLFVMTVLEILFTRIGEARIRQTELDITDRTIRKLLALDVGYHERNNTGTSINRLIKGTSRLLDLFYILLWNLFPSFFQAILTLVVLFWYSWEIGLVFLVFLPIFLGILWRGNRITQTAREEYHTHHDAFAGTLGQSIANIRTVKDFHNEEVERTKANTLLTKYSQALYRRIRLGLKNRVFEDGIISTARVLTLALAVLLMTQGRITAGTLVLIMTLTEKAFLNLMRLYRVYYQMQDTEPAVERLVTIQREPLAMQDGDIDKPVQRGKVEFRDVDFRYGERDRDALQGVSFTVKPLQTVALVGRSGSGKSTTVKLLLRHFDPTGGEILLDDVPLRAYRMRRLREAVAVVSQDVELFNDTILANIAYGAPGATRAQVLRVAKLAHAHEFIVRFPQGYETLVGERGIKLSGGQKQRIAIARALLRKPKVLVFDEATSSLDAESERYIHESIFRLVGKVTLIIIAHRFSTIQHAQQVILLERGRVQELGSHEELLRKKGIFAKLRRLQQLQ